MDTITVTYTLIWEVDFKPYYKLTKCGKLFNCKSGNEVNYPLPKGEGASEVITPTNVGSSFRFLSLRPTDKLFLIAKFLMFMAALISRSNKVLQLLQVHSRSLSVNSLLMLPQHEQSFDDGSNLPILRMFLPYHSALYSNISTNIDHPQSEIESASLWLANIPFMFKSSMQIVWLSLISLLEVLWRKSLRWFATFSYNFANLCFVRFPFFLENFRCVYFNLDMVERKNLGLSKHSPSEVTRKVLMPKSIPTDVFSSMVAFGFIVSPVSQRIETKYLPVGVLDIVACLISPFIGRCKVISIPFLNFGIINLPFSKDTFCGILKLPPFDFFLNFGKFPCPLKKRVKALSKFLIGCCKDWELISFNHSHSFLSSGSCLIKSKQLRFTLLPAHAICFVSNAKLYTKRELPICLFSKTDCSGVGYNLYRKLLSIGQIYKFLQKYAGFFKKYFLSLCMQQPYHKKPHSKYLIKLHFVIAVKYRKSILVGKISDDIQQIVFDCCTKKGIIIDAMESDKDHLHILVDIPPTFSAFDIIHRIKQIKQVYNGGSIGYWIDKKFYTIQKLKPFLKKIQLQNLPF